MTRTSFLLTLPILSLFNKEKFIDFDYEYQLYKTLFHQCPTKIGSDGVTPVFGDGPIVDKCLNQWERIYILERLYGKVSIKNGLVRVTERQFAIDLKYYHESY